VNEPIELTDSQVNDVARQLPKDYDLLVKQSQVSVMVRLINKVRDGDPVGTVRRVRRQPVDSDPQGLRLAAHP
jgi:hypothetical protein